MCVLPTAAAGAAIDVAITTSVEFVILCPGSFFPTGWDR